MIANLPGLILFGLGLIFATRLLYEAWIAPEKYQKRLDNNRSYLKDVFGWSYRGRDRPNLPFVRLVTIFLYLICLAGVVFSITGNLRQ